MFSVFKDVNKDVARIFFVSGVYFAESGENLAGNWQ